MSPTRTILAFGSGPGIGNHVVSQFASHDFNHAILLARNEDRLKNEDAAFVSNANPSVKVDTLRLDLSDLDSIPAVLKEIDRLTEGEDLEVVFFNAARIKGSAVLEVDVGEIEEDLRVCAPPPSSHPFPPANDTRPRHYLSTSSRSTSSPACSASSRATPLPSPVSWSPTAISPGRLCPSFSLCPW